MQRLGKWLPILSFLIILGIGLLTFRLQAPFNEHLRRALTGELSRLIGRKVQLQGSRVSWFPGWYKGERVIRLNLQTPTLAEKTELEGVFLSADKLIVDFAPGRIWEKTGTVGTINRIHLIRPQLRLVRDSQGKWNFSDLLERRPKTAPAFQGKIELEDGILTLQDYAPPSGLISPQQNQLVNFDLSVFSPEPGKAYFRLSGYDGSRLGKIFFSGRREELADSVGSAPQIRLSGSLNLSKVDLGYLWQYRTFSPEIELARGTGDLIAYFNSSPNPRGRASLDYTLFLSGRQAELSLPWLKQPAKELAGKVRISNGLVQFDQLRGRMGQAEVTGGGYLLAAAPQPAGVRSSPSDPPAKEHYALSFHAAAITGKELTAALPKAAAVELASLQGKSEFQVNLAGKKKIGTIFGDFASPELALATTSPAGLPNKLQAATGEFIYHNKALAASAKATLQSGTAQALLLVSPAQEASFFAALSGLKIQNPALGKADLQGELWGNLQGNWKFASSAGPKLTGQLVFSQGVIRADPQSEEALSFSRLSADFSYADRQAHIPRLLLESEFGALAFAGTLTKAEVTGRLEAQALDLTKLGEKYNLPMQGIAFASADLSGPWSAPQLTARADVFSGRWQNFGVDWLSAQAQSKGKEISDLALVLQRGSGEAEIWGNLMLPGADQPGKLAITGTIEKAQLSEWLTDKKLQQNLSGVLDSTLALTGTFSQPKLATDFSLHRPALAGMQLDAASGRVLLENREWVLENFIAQVDHAQLTAGGRLRDQALALTFRGDGLNLAAFALPLKSCPAPAGRLSLRGELQGNPASPHLSAWMKVEDLALAERRIGDLEADLQWQGRSLAIKQFNLAVPGGKLALTGSLTKPDKVATAQGPAWESDLQLDLQGMPIGLIFDIADRCSGENAAASREGKILAGLPRPLHGFLSAAASLKGNLAAPEGKVDFVLSEGSVAGQHLPALEGALSFVGRDLTINSLVAKEGEAFATAEGKVAMGGNTDLAVEVHNLNAAVLRPWVEVPGLQGSADIFLQVTGATAAPRIRGDLEVADPVFGNLALERLKVDSFLIDGESLTVDNLRIVKGPHLASLSASLPCGWRGRKLSGDCPLQGEARLEGQDLAFITALWPKVGEFSGPLEAQVVIGGSAAQPRLESGFVRAQGSWRNLTQTIPFSFQGEVRDKVFRLEAENASPGFLATVAGRGGQNDGPGKLSAQGYYDPFAGPSSRWGLGKYQLALKADNFPFLLLNLLKGRADADLVLQGDPAAEQTDRISGAVSVPRAQVEIPSQAVGKSFTWRPSFSPYLDIQIIAQEIIAETSSAKVTFAGEGQVGGRLGYEPLALTARLRADKGTLDFPAATAEVKAMEIDLDKQPEAPLRALGRVTAIARVGRYRIDLSGGGLLLPENDLRITASASPALSSEQAIGLLLGLPPNLAGTSAEEALGRQVTQNLSSSFTSLAATGLSAPLLRAIGLNELSFGFSPVATNVQIGKRLAEKLYIYYFSSLSGNAKSTLLRFIFDLTPTFSLGISVDDRQIWRYEVQTSKGF